ncbi:uncharacterized protein SPAPADRAFT_63315 [Spathaspora passalidarum NRRL Y-27907]|uniref:C2H2-type domain-containing protein n=1 Tax=Spathaspora passalidarum (strain NRRL Y-27907 / 11-Y1) TaxID=619300 RepID=G3AUB9_SPAPN|nr:uncharacterized protein SPAPADRAFT_63315 [Spathaspora passalidarum NRRL Y-27907]EGW30495.1 hypothetical protein SPAPADRAFT_63315 [Spathaspora passalidarum NRRL Y-27907]
MEEILTTTQPSNKSQENLQTKFGELSVKDVDQHTDFEMKENVQEHHHEQTGIDSRNNLESSDHQQVADSTDDGNDQSYAKSATGSSAIGDKAVVLNQVDFFFTRNDQVKLDDALYIGGCRYICANPDPKGFGYVRSYSYKIQEFPGIFILKMINVQPNELEKKKLADGDPKIVMPTCSTCGRWFPKASTCLQHVILHTFCKVQKLEELTQERLDSYWTKTETWFNCIVGDCTEDHDELAQARWHALSHADPGSKIRNLIPVPKPEFFMKKINDLIHCIGCNRVFESSRDFENHYLIHLGDFPFACKVCYKPFNQKSKLVYHFCYECNERKKKQNLEPSK